MTLRAVLIFAPVLLCIILTISSCAQHNNSKDAPVQPLSSAQSDAEWEEKNHAAMQALQQGKKEEAKSLLLDALKLANAFGQQDIRLGATLNNLASIHDSEGKYVDAEKYYEQALLIFEKSPHPDNPGLIAILTNLARLEGNQSEFAKASFNYKRALELEEKLLGTQHCDVALTLCALADIYSRQEKYLLADPLYKQALVIEVKLLGRDNPLALSHLENYARFVRKMNRGGEADRLEALARKIRGERKK